jgi:hypothetical protein
MQTVQEQSKTRDAADERPFRNTATHVISSGSNVAQCRSRRAEQGAFEHLAISRVSGIGVRRRALRVIKESYFAATFFVHPNKKNLGKAES